MAPMRSSIRIQMRARGWDKLGISVLSLILVFYLDKKQRFTCGYLASDLWMDRFTFKG